MRSKLDPSQIQQMVYDEDSEAMKVKLQELEMSIELDHTDGDSVTAHPHKAQASVLGFNSDGDTMVDTFDCSSLSKVRVDIDGTGTFKILASPCDEGDFFYQIGSELSAGSIIEICARRLKVISIDFQGDLHLVGKA